MVSPTYLVSPNGLWFVKLSETGRLAIFRDGGETEFAPIGGNFGEEYGPYILTLSTPCTLVIRSTTKNRDKDSN